MQWKNRGTEDPGTWMYLQIGGLNQQVSQVAEGQGPLPGAFCWQASAPCHPPPDPCADAPQGGEHGEVLVDLQHGGIQQRVDVAQTLQPSL